MLNPWFGLTFQATQLTWEAQGVMVLRLMKLAGGGSAAQSEAGIMITEKVAALSKAHAVAITAVLGGNSGTRAARQVLNVYKKKVRSNKRRLSRILSK